MSLKRRALVLRDEAARHPFLASLPPHVRRVADNGAVQHEIPRPAFDLRSWRDFASAYCATFVAVTVFIA